MRRIRNKKNNFEPSNSHLLESGFDGQVFQMFMVTPVSQPWLMTNDGEPLEYDMDDFDERHISDDINNIENYK